MNLSDTFLGVERPNSSFLCAASSRKLIEAKPRGSTFVTFTPNAGEEPFITDDYYFRYFPNSITFPFEVAVYDVKDSKWRDAGIFNEEGEPVYRYFFFEFPWKARDGFMMPTNGIIVWFPFHISSSLFDVDWILEPYVDPDSRSLKSLDHSRVRFADEMEEERRLRSMDEHRRNVRARLMQEAEAIDISTPSDIEEEGGDEDGNEEDESTDSDPDDEEYDRLTNEAVAEYEEQMQQARNVVDVSGDSD